MSAVARAFCAAIAVMTAMIVAGCGTPREKTAPCKRPANLMGYVSDVRRADCGPMRSVNAFDVQSAIDATTSSQTE
jgi:hypothetical protein